MGVVHLLEDLVGPVILGLPFHDLVNHVLVEGWKSTISPAFGGGDELIGAPARPALPIASAPHRPLWSSDASPECHGFGDAVIGGAFAVVQIDRPAGRRRGGRAGAGLPVLLPFCMIWIDLLQLLGVHTGQEGVAVLPMAWPSPLASLWCDGRRHGRPVAAAQAQRPPDGQVLARQGSSTSFDLLARPVHMVGHIPADTHA